MSKSTTYVAYPHPDRIVFKCGRCFRGNLRQHGTRRVRCKVCGAMNGMFYRNTSVVGVLGNVVDRPPLEFML